jgi:hypothetical protein
MPPNPLATQNTPPLLKGFAIREYKNPNGDAVDAQALWNLQYSPPGSTDGTPYSAANIYRLALKVEYPQGMVLPGTFSPMVFAIFYAGTTRDDDTPVLPLVSAGIGPAGISPICSQVYDNKMAAVRDQFMIEMQQQNPDPDLKNFYYGFLQLDYHYPQITYAPGIHTIELMLGWGTVKAQPGHWTDPLTCQWDIP